MAKYFNPKSAIKKVYKWVTATRLRKVLSSTLAILMVLTSIRFIFLQPKEVRADVLLKFNEGYGTTGAVHDTNGSISPGNITNATWTTSDLCKNEMCLYFDGSGDYVSFADNPNLDFSAGSTFTIEGWFRHPIISTNPDYLIAKHESGTAGGYKIYMDSDGDMVFGIDDDGTWDTTDIVGDDQSKNYDDNLWHHFAAVKNGTSGIYLYVDGVLIDSDESLTETGNLANAASLYIGIDADGSSNSWSGFIDEIAILRTARSQTEIITDYLGPTSTTSGSSPIAWWRMDEASWSGTAGEVKDQSGNGLNGTRGGNATTSSGKFNNAGTFDGTDDYVSVSDPGTSSVLDFDSGSSITISAWIYPTSFHASGDGSVYIIKGGTLGTGDLINYTLQSQTGCTTTCDLFFHFYGSSSQIYDSDSNILSLNEWQHVAVTYTYGDGNSIKMYHNGSLVSGSWVFGNGNDSPSPNNSPLWVGAENYPGGGSVDSEHYGGIDDVRIYNYLRTPTQILEDMVGYPPGGTSAAFGPDESYLSDGLIGYWKMDEASLNGCSGGEDSCDSSGNSIHGTWEATMDTTNIVAGKYGNGVDFDGSVDYISLGDQDLTDDFTVTAWINPDDLTTDEGSILSKWNGQDGRWNFMTTTAGVLEFLVYDPAGSGCSSNLCSQVSSGNTITISDGWYHVAMTYDDEANDALFYINGVQQTTTENGAIVSELLTGTDDMRIGRREDNNDEVNGQIDETRIYNRALSPVEVQALYTWAPGPVAYYPFDEGTGTSNVYDRSGQNVTASMNGSMTESDWVTGKFGSALDFDNSDDFINGGSASVLDDMPSFTAEAWINPRSNGEVNEGIIIAKESGGDANGWNLSMTDYFGSGYGIKFTLGRATEDLIVHIGDSISINTWQHVAVVYDNSLTAANIEMYINGILQNHTADANGSGNRDTDASHPLTIGADWVSQAQTFDGLIDDVRVYDYERTQEQVVSDMNAGHPAPGSPVGSALGHWKFDEGYGDTAYDSGTGGNNGDLGGSGVSCPGSSTCPTPTNNGKFGKALDFDFSVGVDDVRYGDIDMTGDMTISAWVNPDTLASDEGVILSKYDNDTQKWAFRTGTSGELNFIYANTAGSCGTCDKITNTGVISTSGGWYHVVAVYTSADKEVEFYVNGDHLTKATNNTFDGVLGSGDDELYSGRRGDSNDKMDGQLDDLRLYASALTADQIKVLYNQGSASAWGSTSTDSSGVASWSAANEYCPPGQGSTCTGPIAHFKIDENTGTGASAVKDTSVNEYHGTMESSMTASDWVPGKYGSALNFDGSNDYVDFYSSGFDSDFSEDTGTVTAWFRVNSASVWTDATSRYVVNLAADANNAISIFKATANNTISVRYETAGAIRTVSTTVSDTAWHNIVLTWDTGADEITGYLDGIYMGNATTLGTWSGALASDRTIFGSHRKTSGNYWSGDIDDVKIYNYARTPAQVAWDYNKGAPIGWWRFDECSGVTANDSGSGGNNGTIIPATGNNVGTCSGTAGDMWADGTNGVYNASLAFDGTDDYVQTTSDILATASNFTITGWFKNTDLDYGMIFWQGDALGNGGGSEQEMSFSVRDPVSGTSNRLTFHMEGTSDLYMTNTYTDTGNWHHFTIIVTDLDQGTVTTYLYLDGLLKDTDTGSGLSRTNWDTNFRIGRPGTAERFFDGQIDDVRIYNYALTQQQINDVYNGGAAVRFQ